MADRKKRRGRISNDAFTGFAGKDKCVQVPDNILKENSSGSKRGISGFYAGRMHKTFRQNVQKQTEHVKTSGTGEKAALQDGRSEETFGQNVRKQGGTAAGSEKISTVCAEDFSHIHTSGQNVQKSGAEFSMDAVSGCCGNNSVFKGGSVKTRADFSRNESGRGRDNAGLKKKRKSTVRIRKTAHAAFRQNVQKSGQEPKKEAKPFLAESSISSRRDEEERAGVQDEKQIFSEEPFAFYDTGRQPQKKCRRRIRPVKKHHRKKPGRQEAVSGSSVRQKDGFHDKAEKIFTENNSSFTPKVAKKSTKPVNEADRKRRQVRCRQYGRNVGSAKNNNSYRDAGGNYDASGRNYANAENCRNMEGSRNTENRTSGSHANNFKDSSGQHLKDDVLKDAVLDSSEKADDKVFKGSRKLQRKKRQAEKARSRMEKEKAKIPKKRKYTIRRVFDEKTGRGRQVLICMEQEAPLRNAGHVRNTMRGIREEGKNFVHKKISETEKENCAVEGMHHAEQKAEDLFAFVKRRNSGKNARQRTKIKKLEKRYFEKEVRFQYRKFLEENPQMQKKILQKRMQKRRIKKAYGKAKRNGAAGRDAHLASAAARKLQRAAVRRKGTLAAAAVLALFFLMAASAVSSCSVGFSSIQSAVLASAYLSRPSEIDAADLEFTRLELGLQDKIDQMETDYPGYDEYSYNLGEIGHDPFVLISYLSAAYAEFTAGQVWGEIQTLFDEMYTLDITPDTETGERQVQAVGADGSLLFDSDGNPVMAWEEYEKSVLRITLTVKPLETIAAEKLDVSQTDFYGIYMESKGLLQQFGSPLDLDWYPYVSSYYGYRKSLSGADELHRGIDIAVPEGTQVYAAHDGTVIEASYDSYYGSYVVIERDGYTTRYAHMGSLHVSTGQAVAKGTVIGLTGSTGSSTGSSLHLECLYDGEYYNPLFYFDTGIGSLYGGAADAGAGGAAAGGGSAGLPDSYDDASVQALVEEAAKYIGFPYVWGGSSPSTSFDCSGFVCWVFTNSGVHDLPRTTAQGIYDQCMPVATSEAVAGDIIFFTGTYNSPGPVSHVGIYCGNGIMAHAGDPISFTSINTPYWQSHFYSFGRLL